MQGQIRGRRTGNLLVHHYDDCEAQVMRCEFLNLVSSPVVMMECVVVG